MGLAPGLDQAQNVGPVGRDRPMSNLFRAVCALGRRFAPVALVALAPAAHAGVFSRDSCVPDTRGRRCETRAEHDRARWLGHLDCAALSAYAESSRLATNATLQATYYRLPNLGPPER